VPDPLIPSVFILIFIDFQDLFGGFSVRQICERFGGGFFVEITHKSCVTFLLVIFCPQTPRIGSNLEFFFSNPSF
jgi:hypothetical protein